MTYLAVYGGSGATRYGRQYEQLHYETYLDSGSGSDAVYVEGTTGRIFVNGDSGQDDIFVGNSGSLAGIAGAVDV